MSVSALEGAAGLLPAGPGKGPDTPFAPTTAQMGSWVQKEIVQTPVTRQLPTKVSPLSPSHCV